MEDEAPSIGAACTDLGLCLSRVQGEDAEHKPAYCRLQEEEGAGMKIKSWSGTGRECGVGCPACRTFCALQRGSCL